MPPTLQDTLQHHQAGELPQAAQLYREILIADPRHADAYHLLGVLMHQLQHCQIAVDLISRAIQINHGFTPDYNNLGNALVALGRREDSRASFRRSIHLNRNADTYINLATLDLGDGRIRESEAGFRAALRLSPKRWESLVGLGRIAIAGGQNNVAKRWLERALSIKPDCVSALNCLGDLCVEEERFHEAEVYYARATECLPWDVDAHLKLGHLYMRLERPQSAAEFYGKAYPPEGRSRSRSGGPTVLCNGTAAGSWSGSSRHCSRHEGTRSHSLRRHCRRSSCGNTAQEGLVGTPASSRLEMGNNRGDHALVPNGEAFQEAGR
jgi:tetratricopeptide (TPR) repeat protein